jgi:1-acyl-sn-glycerol-3-phosphate acyltransferase
MTLIRSLIYVLWLYGSMTVIGLSFGPVAIFSEPVAIKAAETWARAMLWGARVIVGLKLEVRGQQYIPQGAALVAAKHQSMLDTIVPFLILHRPSVVLKRELLKLPIFGWFSQRAGMIVVNREAHAAALRSMLKDARKQAANGRPIVIFPEGTRQKPGAPPDYKPGVAALYRDLKLPCVPVALNAGLYWPAHGVVRRPGTVVIEFLPAIPPGLSREAFMAELETRIETASNALLPQGVRTRPA